MTAAAEQQVDTAGFCLPIAPEEIEQWRRRYDEASLSRPRQPPPPMANIALALELATGANAIRSYEFLDTTYRFLPTPYLVALQLMAWHEKLGQLTALGTQVFERLPELRECYVSILDLAMPLMRMPDDTQPNYLQLRRQAVQDALSGDFRELTNFLLASGNQRVIKRPPDEEQGQQYSYDAAYYLCAYLAVFGAIPGMVVLDDGRPTPASWRHFQAGVSYLRRHAAEQALEVYGASAQWAEEGPRLAWLQEHQLDAGLW